MSDTNKTLLITGATGRQGGAVVRHLLGKGWQLRALTRDPGSAAATALACQGVEVVPGDFDDLSSLEQATSGVYGIYSVQDFWSVGARREVEQGKRMAEVAKRAGVAHFVYSSVGGVERNAGIGHWASKWEIEQYIDRLGLPTTMIRPVSFMENYYLAPFELSILQGRLLDPVRADKPYQTIAVDDIGAFVALAFARPQEFVGQALEIAGSELTNPEAAAVFGRVLGKPVVFEQLPLETVRSGMGEEYYQMFSWFNAAGYQANIADLRRRYPEVRLQTLEDWLRSEGWHKHARPVQLPPA